MREILGVLVPFFAIVALGYGAARLRVIWQSGLNGLNAYLFNFALPVMLFRGVASRDLAELDARLPFVYALATTGLFLGTTAVAARAFALDRPIALFHGLGAVQANKVSSRCRSSRRSSARRRSRRSRSRCSPTCSFSTRCVSCSPTSRRGGRTCGSRRSRRSRGCSTRTRSSRR
jgi:hypothetical protein